MYYERPVKNTPDEHGQRPQPGDIVAVFACRCVETTEHDILRAHEIDPEGRDFIGHDMWIGVYVTYRDGRSQAVLDIAVARDEDGDAPWHNLFSVLPTSTIAVVDLLADLPLGRLDVFCCQALGLPTTG